MISPYQNQPIEDWSNITNGLVNSYPISKEEILKVATISWEQLWTTNVGNAIPLDQVDLPATVIGYFFQKLFAKELSLRYPEIWTGEVNKSDKDLVHLINSGFSTEMKSSGQLGYSLFGNRSYNQESDNDTLSGKDKSGYYITLNFYKKQITLLRVGWIDQDDWIPQGAETGQAAILKPEVYDYKLQTILGEYKKNSPVQLLFGIGEKTLPYFHAKNIYTFDDLKNYKGNDKKIIKIKDKNINQLSYSF